VTLDQRNPTAAGQAPTCAAHHWLITTTDRIEHWQCRICGSVQERDLVEAARHEKLRYSYGARGKAAR